MGNYRAPPGVEGLKQSFFAMFDHSFKSTDFSAQPYRGALFTLSCACLPFVRGPGRLWLIVGILHLSIFLWFLQLRLDRYLVAYMPAMAAVAVAIAVLAWRTSLAARVSVFALFAFHTLWGLGMFATGAPSNQYRNVLDFLQAAAANNPDAGMGNLARFEHAGKSMARDALVLVHDTTLHAGLNHASVNDWPRAETGIAGYGRLDSPGAVYRLLRGLGITNLLWDLNYGDDSVAGDLRFYEFAVRYAAPTVIDGLWVGKMPNKAPPEATGEPELIANLACDGKYAPGLYPFSAMTVPNPRDARQPSYPRPLEPITVATEGTALDRAAFVVFQPNCGFSDGPIHDRQFEHIGQRSNNAFVLFARKASP